jgi:hypothetical protein
MLSHLGQAFSFLSLAAQPAGSHSASARPLLDRKHPVSACWQIAGSLEFSCPSLRRARSWLRPGLQLHVASWHRADSQAGVLSPLHAASRLAFQASPHSAWAALEPHALFPEGACPLMVIPLAVAPMPLQPARANSLLTN